MTGKRARASRASDKRAAKSKRAAGKNKGKEERSTKAVPPGKFEAPGVFLSINQAAEEFGHDRRTITSRVVELGLRPSGERQGYPVYRLKDLLELERRTPDGKMDPDKMSPFERQAHYKAESEKLRVNQERGMLIRKEDSEAELARVLKVVAQELDTVVDEIERDVGASALVLEKIESKLDTARHRMYGELVNGPTPAPADEESGQTLLVERKENLEPPHGE